MKKSVVVVACEYNVVSPVVPKILRIRTEIRQRMDRLKCVASCPDALKCCGTALIRRKEKKEYNLRGMICLNLKYMTDYYKELFRRLGQLGYTVQMTESGLDDAKIYHCGGLVCIVENKDSFRGVEGYEEHLYKVRDLAKDVSGYMDEYLKAQYLEPESHLDDYRKLMDIGGYILAAKQLEHGGFSFVTWKRDAYGEGYIWGNYFDDYRKACENFAIRSGMVDKDKMFDETQLKLIYSSLVQLVRLDRDMSLENEKAIGKVLEQIENIMPDVLPRNALEAEADSEAELEL